MHIPVFDDEADPSSKSSSKSPDERTSVPAASRMIMELVRPLPALHTKRRGLASSGGGKGPLPGLLANMVQTNSQTKVRTERTRKSNKAFAFKLNKIEILGSMVISFI